jgi:hypothetical protein
MAIKMPKVLKNLPTDKKSAAKLMNRVGIALNAIIPILYGIFFIVFTHELFVTQDPKESLSIVVTITTIGNYTCQIVSGCILVLAIYKVRAYMLSNRIDSRGLNTKSMCLHATAFCLYVASVVGYTVFIASYTLKKNNKNDDDEGLEIAAIAMFVTSFFSQCLLCIIFW